MELALSRRERKKLETRQGLMEAGLTLFREKGYDETTVEEITERADVAKGTFFNYFPSKEALLGELAVWRVEQLRSALDMSLGAPKSPVARIKLLTILLHEQVIDDVHVVWRALATRLSSPPPPPQRVKHQFVGLLTDLVREAQACGEIRADVEAELVSDLLHLSYVRRMVACRSDGAQPLSAQHLEQIIDLLMEGLAGPNWRRA